MTCEKCWSDSYAYFDSDGKSQTQRYHALLIKRRENPCTPEQQAGPDANECPYCKRFTIHQYVKTCVICLKKQ